LTEVLYNASVYRDAGGKVLGVFAAARDVTEQNRAETELAEQRLNELDRMADLERFQRLTVGRDLKMSRMSARVSEGTCSLPNSLIPQPGRFAAASMQTVRDAAGW
jgi:hypothetical protein